MNSVCNGPSSIKDNNQTNVKKCDHSKNIQKQQSMEHIYYENIRSIPAKTNIKYRIIASSYQILCFTETLLSEHHKSETYFPENFDVHRRDRGSVGGGVAIIVDKKLGSQHLDQINDPICECVCVKIPSKPKPLIIYVGYLPQWQQTNNIAYSAHIICQRI